MSDFNYLKAADLEEAAVKQKSASEGEYLAGGMTLLPAIKLGLNQPSDLVDLAGIADLQGVRVEGGNVVVGAMTRHADVAASGDVQAQIPALADLASGIGDPQVRNRGTLGGSLANNDPAASYPAAVLGLGATIKTNKRSIEADDFFTGMFDTALEEGELITAVSFPIPEQAGYKHFPNPASRFPIVGAFVAKTGDGVRVGITGAAPCAYRQTSFEDALSGGLDPEKLKGIEVAAEGMNSDIHASAEYRAHLVNVMARRAIGG